jgi:hypothetical protein
MPTGFSRDPEIERARTFARAMDHYGLDPILGFLLPGIGDLVGAALGLYIVSIAKRRGLSRAVIARMLLNLVLDMALGAIPLIGDVADVAFKANDKNLSLLETRTAQDRTSSAVDWAYLAGVVVAAVAVCGLVVYGFVRLVEYAMG